MKVYLQRNCYLYKEDILCLHQDLKKNLPATALAKRVFPIPGGPTSNTPIAKFKVTNSTASAVTLNTILALNLTFSSFNIVLII